MIQNGAYQISTVHELAFNRQGGTEEERRAARLIQEEIASFGGTSSLEHMVQYLAREYGFDTVCKRVVRSSDSAVFADVGIPAIDFVRRGKGVMHNRNDLEEQLSAAVFARTQTFMRQFLCRVMRGEEFPIPRVMPQDMKEALDRHFLRTTGK